MVFRPRLLAQVLPALVGLALAVPSEAVAQVRISVEWNGTLSGGPWVYAEYGTGGAYVVGSFGHPAPRYRAPRPRRPVHVRRGVRIPPGHLPGPGECRVWHPNRPPGHQPPPFRCSDRYHDPYRPGSAYRPGFAYGSGAGYGPAPVYGPAPARPTHLVVGGRVERGDERYRRDAERRWAKLEREARKERRKLGRGGKGRGGGR